MLVGAGGHFCPVSRSINGPTNTAPVVVAQEAEFPIDSGDRAAFAIDGEAPELYFCRDLKGYGWCFRKAASPEHRSWPSGPAVVARSHRRVRRVPRRHGRRSHRAPHRGGAGMRMPCTAPRIVASSTRVCCWPATPPALPILKAARGSARRSSRDCWRRRRSSRRADGTPANRLQPYEDRLQARFGTGPVSRALTPHPAGRLRHRGRPASAGDASLRAPRRARPVVPPRSRGGADDSLSTCDGLADLRRLSTADGADRRSVLSDRCRHALQGVTAISGRQLSPRGQKVRLADNMPGV